MARPARDFAAHEFRRDEQRHRGAEALAVGGGLLRALQLHLAPEILALGDIDHLLGDDAGAGEFQLGDGLVRSLHSLRCCSFFYPSPVYFLLSLP